MSRETERTLADANQTSEFSAELVMMLETVEVNALVSLCGRGEVPSMLTTMNLKPLEHESLDVRLLPSVSITCGIMMSRSRINDMQ